jgi:hypothetical protein
MGGTGQRRPPPAAPATTVTAPAPAIVAAPVDVSPVKIGVMPLRIMQGNEFRWAVYAQGTDGRVWWRLTDVDGVPIGAWSPIDGVVSGGPDVVQINIMQLMLAARSTTGSLLVKESTDTAFPEPWTDLGGVLTSAPDLAVVGQTVVMAGRGTDGAVWFRVRPTWDAAWSPWRSLGGRATSAPDVAGGNSSVLVQVRGTDGMIWSRAMATNGNPAGAWYRWPIVISSAPSAVYERDGMPRTWWRGSAGDLRTARNGSRSVTSYGGRATSAPSASEGIPNGGTIPQVVAVRGTDGSVWLYTFAIHPGWHALGGQVI